MVNVDDIIDGVLKKGVDISFVDFVVLNIDTKKFSINFSNVDKISSITRSIIDIKSKSDVVLFDAEVIRINNLISDIDSKLNTNIIILGKLKNYLNNMFSDENEFVKDFITNRDFSSLISGQMVKDNLDKTIDYFNTEINSLNKEKLFLLEYLDSINFYNIKDKLLERLGIDLSYYSDFYNENMSNVKLYAEFINFLFRKNS